MVSFRCYNTFFPKISIIFVILLVIFLFKVVYNNHEFKVLPMTTTTDIKPKQVTLFDTVNYKDKYCILYYLWDYHVDYTTNLDVITLVLHASPSHLKYLEAQIRSWTGPISVAVFVPTPEDTQIRKTGVRVKAVFSALQMLEKRLMKVQNGKSKVALHAFFERQGTLKCPVLNISTKLSIEFPVKLNDLAHFMPPVKLYPINTARNIAREGAMSNLFISGDMEQVYSDGFESVMRKLGNRIITREGRQLALVHRRFEVANNVAFPSNKLQLKKLITNKLAVPFHHFVYPIGHVIPGLDEWLNSPNYVYGVTEVSYNNTLWEPQFVAARITKTPFHDERFPYRFKTNTHLALLLCYHNYTFAVVDNIFSVHRGIKYNQTLENEFIYAYGKRKGLHKIFDVFNKELNDTYSSEKVSQCGTLFFDASTAMTSNSTKC